jgi:hypothetical protein
MKEFGVATAAHQRVLGLALLSSVRDSANPLGQVTRPVGVNAPGICLRALGRADEMVLAEKAPRNHFSAKNELPALEAGHHGFGTRRGDDGACAFLM